MNKTITLDYIDYKNKPVLWAKRLGISLEAVELYLESEIIDHIRFLMSGHVHSVMTCQKNISINLGGCHFLVRLIFLVAWKQICQVLSGTLQLTLFIKIKTNLKLLGETLI